MGDAGRGTGGILSMTFGSLFAGIGGIDLGLERAGMECKWQVENDDYATRVLAKHWPRVYRHGDIKTFRGLPADLVCGGWPCQDISRAGRGDGLDGERSGLWFEMLRIIRDVRPRWVFLENVSTLLIRGIDSVLGSLAEGGFDCQWDCIPASAIGSPHRRDRVWIIANSNGERRDQERPRHTEAGCNGIERNGWWATEPDVGRVAYGIPARVDRLRGLGNAVVPHVAEWIGRRIIEADKA